jgi:hypothetical protein
MEYNMLLIQNPITNSKCFDNQHHEILVYNLDKLRDHQHEFPLQLLLPVFAFSCNDNAAA